MLSSFLIAALPPPPRPAAASPTHTQILHHMTLPYIMPPPEQLPHPLSGDAISPAYIHTVQHLIEKCLLFHMDREECAASLEKHAQVKPAVTRTVWNELEKANSEFFTAYLQRSSRSSSHHNEDDSLNKALLEATNALCQQRLDD